MLLQNVISFVIIKNGRSICLDCLRLDIWVSVGTKADR